jgi:UDP-glucose 4-epimerase
MIKHKLGITGGSGYIGSSLAKHFAESFDVKLIDVNEPKEKFQENVSFQKCDIRNYAEVQNAVTDVDVIIHAAIIQIPAINERKKLGYDVNFFGTQNICRAVDESENAKGLILSGSWHTIGEKGLSGLINEEFGFRPDKVEDRARLYALSKMAQESIVRFYDEMSPKVFGILRMGTVLGQGMPEKTAANIFINNGLAGKSLTPFKCSMCRPMLYVDLNDICQAYVEFVNRILGESMKKDNNSLSHIFNVYYPEIVTIAELAELVRSVIFEQSKEKVRPTINVVETEQPSGFNKNDKSLIKVDTTKALKGLGIKKLKSPKESIEEIVKNRISSQLMCA